MCSPKTRLNRLDHPLKRITISLKRQVCYYIILLLSSTLCALYIVIVVLDRLKLVYSTHSVNKFQTHFGTSHVDWSEVHPSKVIVTQWPFSTVLAPCRPRPQNDLLAFGTAPYINTDDEQELADRRDSLPRARWSASRICRA